VTDSDIPAQASGTLDYPYGKVTKHRAGE
jgi:hypothetical protein